jgi:hypothetical protein
MDSTEFGTYIRLQGDLREQVLFIYSEKTIFY